MLYHVFHCISCHIAEIWITFRFQTVSNRTVSFRYVNVWAEEQVTRTSCSNMEAQRSSQESSIRTMKEESWGFFYRCMFTSHVLVCACALKLCPRVEQVLDSRLLDIQDKVSCSSVFFCRFRAKLLDQKVLGLFPGSDTKCQCIWWANDRNCNMVSDPHTL